MRRILAMLVISAVGASCYAGQSPPDQSPATVGELIGLAEDNHDGRFMVTGRLENAGTNYFSDRRIVLLDLENNQSIAVRAWLPLEAYPAQDPDAPQRTTMADFLDKDLELIVTPTKAPVKGVGIVPVLEVHSAHIVE